MKQSLKLSNHLFGWFMKENGIGIFFLSLAFGLGSMIQTMQRGSLELRTLTEFYSYDMILDRSMVFLDFCVGLLFLLIFLFLQVNSFQGKTKGMYTILTLPMKRRDVFFAFFFEALAVVSLYFAFWLILMVAAYVPVTAIQAKAVAELSFLSEGGQMVTGVDTSLHNGLYLAFQRSQFLRGCFPVSTLQGFLLGGGVFLGLVSFTFAGMYQEGGMARVTLLGVAGFGFLMAFNRSIYAWMGEGNVDYFFANQNIFLIGVATWILGCFMMVLAVKYLARQRNL